MWVYEIATGRLYRDGLFVSLGFSGHGNGMNNPAMQNVHKAGPLPVGLYTIEPITDEHGHAVDYERKKAPVFRLRPSATNQMWGRAGFLIHGDSIAAPGAGSEGCMIESHDVRLAILRVALAGDVELQVVDHLPAAQPAAGGAH